MKTNAKQNSCEAHAEQVTNPLYDHIFLGVDLHKKSISVTRIIDGGTPQAAQRMDWDKFWKFARKQTALARHVYAVYEAGAFGFWPQRRLQALGLECWVVHPEKLDPRQRRVQTDQTDALHLALKLQRYVGGNLKAMTPVFVPTEEQEQQRLAARHRDHLGQQLHALQARGRGLLLSQGVFEAGTWWRPAAWEKLQARASAALVAVLQDLRQSIEHVTEQLDAVEKTLVKSAPKELPLGLGALTFVLLQRLICTFERFKNRRQVGGFTGLCGGVSSSGDYHLDLSINKVGSPRLRTLLVEAAWRLIYHQPQYTGLRTWKRLGGAGAAKRRRKIALVATARQLMVDLWRWQTGRVTAQQLGWQLRPTV